MAAHYDNSVNNPHNPNPNEAVHWASKVSMKMFGEITDVAVPVNTSVRTVIAHQENKPAGWTKQAKVDRLAESIRKGLQERIAVERFDDGDSR